MDWIFNVPIKFFEYDLAEFKDKLLNFKDKQSIVIASDRLLSSCNLKSIFDEFDNIFLINESIANPDIHLLDKIMSNLSFKPELIISIGGGSSIDLAKAISALFKYKDDLDYEKILELLKTKEYLENEDFIPFIAVPTTAGTGSECTKWATIWDFDNSKKYSIDADYLYPQESWLVPELTSTLNPELTLATGLDALSHAMESYWSNASNSYTRVLARDSIKIITKYLPLVLSNLDNLDYRKQMLMGSFFAGLAFSNTRTTASHSISYPLTMKFEINHGFAVAITLFEVLKRNSGCIEDKELFLESFGAKNINDVEKWFKDVSDDIQDLNLSSFGVKKEEIEDIVKLATTGGRMDNNPIIFNEKEIEDILINVF